MQNSLRLLIELIISLVKAQASLADGFFNNRLEKKIYNLLESYLNSQGESKDSVAQYKLAQQQISLLDPIIEFIEELIYLKISDNSPLSHSYSCLLRYKLELLKQLHDFEVDKIYAKQEKQEEPVKESKTQIAPNPNDTAEKILHFIKENPNTRAKDIIDNFKNISERTVKRRLRELINRGLIKKRSENKAVFYSHTNSQNF